MELKVKGIRAHNGFLLEMPFIFNGNIIVLTGKNGSGKTRFLESIQNNSSTVYINDEVISSSDIRFIAQAKLNPSFGNGYNVDDYYSRVTTTLRLYDVMKGDLNFPIAQENLPRFGREFQGGLDYESLFKLCQSISRVLEKPASELTHEDIKLHFEEPSRDVLGIQNVSAIVNQYIQRVRNNKYNKWRCSAEGENVKFWSHEEFLLKFGEKPWVILNNILDNTFDGKFCFSLPDEESQSYAYQAQLFQKDGEPVSVEKLSSGEKTLLWLALTIFNSQYYDDISFTPKILLLDEPDAFLHPKMVLKMYNALEAFSKNFNAVVLVTTHSPTSVALAPNDSIYLVDNNTVNEIEKDRAIADLLDGVTQISLNPNNRRQVFVESEYDVAIYQSIYAKLINRSELIDPKISLSFLSSGPKMPRQQLIDKARKILKIVDDAIINQFCEAINGVGSCKQVIAQVEALIENDSRTVRGIIDWDLVNTPNECIKVFAHQYAYSIENVTLDPICILLLLHIDRPESMTMLKICGVDLDWDAWLDDKSLLQEAINRFILKVLGRENDKKVTLSYNSGMQLETDSVYMRMKGHDLEELLKKRYAGLKSYCRTGKDGELKCTIVNRSMINLTKCKFIPSAYENILSEVQK